MKYLIILALVAISAQLIFDNTLLEDIKNGKKLLICNGKQVSPELVVNFSDDLWWFVNGYAKNCEVKSCQ